MQERLRRRALPARRAFTLIESVATITVLAILGSIASFVVLNAVDGYTEAVTSAQLHAEMSVTLDRITRELRRIELDSAAAGVAPDITSVTSSFIDWEDSDDDLYRILWSSGESALKLAIDGGALAVLQTDVTNCVISTYDEDDVQRPWIISGVACDPIRRVQVELTCQRSGVTETLRTKIFLRPTMSGS